MTDRTSRQRIIRAFWTLNLAIAAAVIAFALRGYWL
jgi:hypothetical protein